MYNTDKQTKINTNTAGRSMFDHFDSIWNFFPEDRLIGYDRPHKEIPSKQAFPVYNVSQETVKDKMQYVIEVALAGYKKEQLQVSLHSGELTISNKRIEPQNDSTSRKMIHQGIATRTFELKFSVEASFDIVEPITFEDGMLCIKLLNTDSKIKHYQIV